MPTPTRCDHAGNPEIWGPCRGPLETVHDAVSDGDGGDNPIVLTLCARHVQVYDGEIKAEEAGDMLCSEGDEE